MQHFSSGFRRLIFALRLLPAEDFSDANICACCDLKSIAFYSIGFSFQTLSNESSGRLI